MHVYFLPPKMNSSKNPEKCQKWAISENRLKFAVGQPTKNEI
jgi:hypothetical protein